MTARIYRDRRGEWRWRLVAHNGRIVADSAEGYTRRRNAARALRIVIAGVWGRIAIKG